MEPSSNFTDIERLQSLKAAILGGVVAGLTDGGLRLLRSGWPGALLSSLGGLTLLVTIAIAALSGSLFALTYRYAVRQDPHPQLKSGVVLAFALVRGLAQVDAASAIAQQYWPLAAALLESLLLFGLTGLGLEVALRQGWVKPFGAG